jgi:AcrR family transcriptional regulator
MARIQTGQKSFIEQARREQIVDAAIDVLCESGFAAASLGAIAERIGVSKGVLSYHFAGKSELLREIVARVLTEAAEYMTPRVAAATSYTDALRIYVTTNLHFIGTHRREILAFTEIVNGMPPGSDDPPPYMEGHQNAVEELRRLLAAGQAAGEFGPFSALVTAVSLRASVDAVSGLLRADPAMDVEAYGAELVGLYERAVRP